MQLILDSTESTSREFSAGSQFGFLISGHAGGIWSCRNAITRRRLGRAQ